MTDTYLGLTSLVISAVSVRLWLRALVRVEIPKNRGPFVAAWGIAAGLAVTALLGEPGWLGGIAAGLSLLPAGFFPFSVAIGGQKLGEEAIRVGDMIPNFTATDEYGNLFDSGILAGHPVLIKFFRGHW